MIKPALTALLLTTLLSGCASSSDIRHMPVTEGTSRDFEAPYEETKRLALESLQGLNVDVNSANESGAIYTVMFSKPMTAFSWGEVGRVSVLDLSPKSRVTVLSEKRARYQITGTGQDEFAAAVFEGIDHALDGR